METRLWLNLFAQQDSALLGFDMKEKVDFFSQFRHFSCNCKFLYATNLTAFLKTVKYDLEKNFRIVRLKVAVSFLF